MDAANKETVKDQGDQKEAFAAEIEGEWTFASGEAKRQGRVVSSDCGNKIPQTGGLKQ